MSLTEREGRGEHSVGLKVLPHITPSLIKGHLLCGRETDLGIRVNNGQVTGWGRGTDKD